MEKYFLIKNEIKNDDEIKGNIFTSKEVSGNPNNLSYTLISKNVLHKLLNAEMQRIEDELYDLENNMNIKPFIKEPREEELRDRIEVAVSRYNELFSTDAGSMVNFDKTKIPTINVFLSSLSDPDFLSDNKELLSNADLNIILNETEMNTIYRGQNIITLDDTLTGRFEKSNYTEKRREYKDENAIIEKYNLISGDFLKKIQREIKPKSIIVKESFDSENEYTIDELDNANKKIEEVAKIINSHKGLSPYEKFYLAFRYVAKYDYKESKNGNKEVSRNLLDILNTNYIVCAGKSNMLKAICDRIGIPCLHRGAEVHAVCTIGMNDPKYNIYGIQTVDPTNQEYPVMYNEDNILPKDVFVGKLNWISELSYRQRDYLIEASGLFDVPEYKMLMSAENFKKDDENLYYIRRKDILKLNKLFANETIDTLLAIENRCIEAKKNYDRKEDLTTRWVELEHNLKDLVTNENERVKYVLKVTDAYKIARDLYDKIVLSQDAYINSFLDEKMFVANCKTLQIEPTKEALDKYLKNFEKDVIPQFNKVISSVGNLTLNFDQILDTEIKYCDTKIVDESQKDRFIPVGKEVQDIEKLLDEVRENHISKVSQFGE